MAIEERMSDPRLQGMTSAQGSEGSGITIKIKENAEPVVPDIGGDNVDAEFDFDAAMDEAEL